MNAKEIRKKIEQARSFRVRVGFFDTRGAEGAYPRVLFSGYVRVSREFARDVARQVEWKSSSEVIAYCWELSDSGTLFIN